MPLGSTISSGPNQGSTAAAAASVGAKGPGATAASSTGFSGGGFGDPRSDTPSSGHPSSTGTGTTGGIGGGAASDPGGKGGTSGGSAASDPGSKGGLGGSHPAGGSTAPGGKQAGTTSPGGGGLGRIGGGDTPSSHQPSLGSLGSPSPGGRISGLATSGNTALGFQGLDTSSLASELGRTPGTGLRGPTDPTGKFASRTSPTGPAGQPTAGPVGIFGDNPNQTTGKVPGGTTPGSFSIDDAVKAMAAQPDATPPGALSPQADPFADAMNRYAPSSPAPAAAAPMDNPQRFRDYVDTTATALGLYDPASYPALTTNMMNKGNLRTPDNPVSTASLKQDQPPGPISTTAQKRDLTMTQPAYDPSIAALKNALGITPQLEPKITDRLTPEAAPPDPYGGFEARRAAATLNTPAPGPEADLGNMPVPGEQPGYGMPKIGDRLAPEGPPLGYADRNLQQATLETQMQKALGRQPQPPENIVEVEGLPGVTPGLVTTRQPTSLDTAAAARRGLVPGAPPSISTKIADRLAPEGVFGPRQFGPRAPDLTDAFNENLLANTGIPVAGLRPNVNKIADRLSPETAVDPRSLAINAPRAKPDIRGLPENEPQPRPASFALPSEDVRQIPEPVPMQPTPPPPTPKVTMPPPTARQFQVGRLPWQQQNAPLPSEWPGWIERNLLMTGAGLPMPVPGVMSGFKYATDALDKQMRAGELGNLSNLPGGQLAHSVPRGSTPAFTQSAAYQGDQRGSDFLLRQAAQQIMRNGGPKTPQEKQIVDLSKITETTSVPPPRTGAAGWYDIPPAPPPMGWSWSLGRHRILNPIANR